MVYCQVLLTLFVLCSTASSLNINNGLTDSEMFLMDEMLRLESEIEEMKQDNQQEVNFFQTEVHQLEKENKELRKEIAGSVKTKL